MSHKFNYSHTIYALIMHYMYIVMGGVPAYLRY